MSELRALLARERRPSFLLRPTTCVFVAALGFLLATHGGHFYASDTLLVYLTGMRLVEEGRLDLERVWGSVTGAEGKRYARYAIGLSLLQAPRAWLGSSSTRSLRIPFERSPATASASTTRRT